VTQIRVGHARAKADVRVRSEVNHAVNPFEMGQRCLVIGQINDSEVDPTGVEMVREKLTPTAGEIVQDANVIAACDQPVNHV
jgi:hypothetical protein